MYTYGLTDVTVPFDGSTVAIGIYIAPPGITQGSQEYTNSLARVQFYDQKEGRVDAVYCDELYKENIEAEKNDKEKNQEYTHAFVSLPTGF